jgi:hypothetical protein
MKEYTTIESAPCIACRKVTKHTVEVKQADAWRKGKRPSFAFPQLTAMEIESLISSVCSDKCWDSLFNEDQKDQGE